MTRAIAAALALCLALAPSAGALGNAVAPSGGASPVRLPAASVGGETLPNVAFGAGAGLNGLELPAALPAIGGAQADPTVLSSIAETRVQPVETGPVETPPTSSVVPATRLETPVQDRVQPPTTAPGKEDEGGFPGEGRFLGKEPRQFLAFAGKASVGSMGAVSPLDARRLAASVFREGTGSGETVVPASTAEPLAARAPSGLALFQPDVQPAPLPVAGAMRAPVALTGSSSAWPYFSVTISAAVGAGATISAPLLVGAAATRMSAVASIAPLEDALPSTLVVSGKLLADEARALRDEGVPLERFPVVEYHESDELGAPGGAEELFYYDVKRNAVGIGVDRADRTLLGSAKQEFQHARDFLTGKVSPAEFAAAQAKQARLLRLADSKVPAGAAARRARSRRLDAAYAEYRDTRVELRGWVAEYAAELERLQPRLNRLDAFLVRKYGPHSSAWPDRMVRLALKYGRLARQYGERVEDMLSRLARIERRAS
ncbi:MAG TPA: hypothetical protein VNI01_07680, partial [Elusimicrobiota bacterium]|jgi:hypothetical protein|nr:hypothetical protein [Elusimicrobiota bacterium]